MKAHHYVSVVCAVAVAVGTIALFASSPKHRIPKPKIPTLERPLIVGVANIGLKTDNLAAARKFYGGILGFQEPLAVEKSGGVQIVNIFRVNDHQYIEVSPGLKSPTEDRLSHIGFETTDAHGLRAYLASRGVTVPDGLYPDRDGNLSFMVTDPDGHSVEFVQYLPGSLESRYLGKLLPPTRISEHIDHVGVTVRDQAAADRFYRDILGFHEIWHGGMTDDRTDWVMMRVPNGKDWLEYMLNVHNPSPRQLGVMHHLSLGVPSTAEVYRIAVERGYTGKGKPQIGRDGKWQYNMYDPNFTRVEVMEPKPVEKPCCSPITE